MKKQEVNMQGMETKIQSAEEITIDQINDIIDESFVTELDEGQANKYIAVVW